MKVGARANPGNGKAGLASLVMRLAYLFSTLDTSPPMVADGCRRHVRSVRRPFSWTLFRFLAN
jgi:hypothetical protein